MISFAIQNEVWFSPLRNFYVLLQTVAFYSFLNRLLHNLTSYNVIHGKVNIFSQKVRLPLSYILMQDRKSETYQAVFKSISKKFEELLNVKLSPEVIKVDLEQTVISAIQQYFPEAEVTDCKFYFNQSLYRRVFSMKVWYNTIEKILRSNTTFVWWPL